MQGGAAPSKETLDRSESALNEAMRHFRSALDADPADQDAAANGQVAQRRLRDLQELREQLEKQSSPQQGEQDQPRQDQQQSQQQQGQQQSQEQEGQQQQQDQQQQGQQEQGQAHRNEPQSEGDERQPAEAAGGAEQEERESAGAGEQGERAGMTREEARRLLQQVRDKEAQRRAALAEKLRAQRRAVDKDW
jgi:hypothetical protein